MSCADVFPNREDRPNNTVDGVNYGLPQGRTANLLIWKPAHAKRERDIAVFLDLIFDPELASRYQGGVTAPDDPMFIADAPLYLRDMSQELRIEKRLRFDESIGRLDGYDLDICLQARAAGRKVITIDTRLIHHHSLGLLGDPGGWIAAHMKVAEKRSDLLDDGRTQDWRERARRARSRPRRRGCSFEPRSTTSPAWRRTSTPCGRAEAGA